MRDQHAPRFQGRITSWKDEQGFGFITPNGGGPTVFVHITSFTSPGRPAANEAVTYELAVNGKGQARAQNVARVRAAASRQAASRGGKRALLVALGFIAFLAACVLTGKLPLVALLACLGLSALAFLAYAADKSAARRGRRRIPESSLHLVALVGGWPGALVAQQVLRHKSKKESFRKTFWVTVVVHCCALGWLLA
ncbi:MAG: DUF1294 domain-containing protein [Telluria sp.]